MLVHRFIQMVQAGGQVFRGCGLGIGLGPYPGSARRVGQDGGFDGLGNIPRQLPIEEVISLGNRWGDACSRIASHHLRVLEESRFLPFAPPDHFIGDIQGLLAIGSVGEPHQAFLGSRSNRTDGGLSRRVGADSIDVRDVLAGKRTATERDARTKKILHELAPRLTVVAVTAAVQQRTVGVDRCRNVRPGFAPTRILPLSPAISFLHRVEYELTNL